MLEIYLPIYRYILINYRISRATLSQCVSFKTRLDFTDNYNSFARFVVNAKHECCMQQNGTEINAIEKKKQKCVRHWAANDCAVIRFVACA